MKLKMLYAGILFGIASAVFGATESNSTINKAQPRESSQSKLVQESYNTTSVDVSKINIFKYYPVEEWVGHKVVFLPLLKEFQKEGYRNFTGGKEKNGRPTYEECVSRIGTVTDVKHKKITIKMDDNGQLYQGNTNESGDQVDDIALIEEGWGARHKFKGQTLWYRGKTIGGCNPETDEVWNIPVRRFSSLQVVDVTLSWYNPSPFRILVRTEKGESGFVDVTFSGTNLSASPFDPYRFDNLFFEQDPKTLYNESAAVWEAIENEKVFIGMTRQQARLSWGAPEFGIDAVETPDGNREKWKYSKKRVLYFDGDKVISGENVEFTPETANPSGQAAKQKSPDWVIPFQDQLEKGIWDGVAVRQKSGIYFKEKYSKLSSTQAKSKQPNNTSGMPGMPGMMPGSGGEEANLQSWYHYNGHIYTGEQIRKIKPKKAATETNLLESRKIGGRIVQHIMSESMILADIFLSDRQAEMRESHLVGFSRFFVVELPAGHRIMTDVPDGQEFSVVVRRDGIYSYETVGGGTKTVDKYSYIGEAGADESDFPNGTKKTFDELRAGEPVRLNFDLFLWAMYCKGLEADLENELLQKNSCRKCDSTGKSECLVCEGKGKYLIEYHKELSPKRSKPNIPGGGMLGMGCGMPGMSKMDGEMPVVTMYNDRETNRLERQRIKSEQERRDSEEKIRLSKQKQRQVEQEQLERSERIRKEEAEKTYTKYEKCEVCYGHGWVGCPKCVLVESPVYADSAKDAYLKRWQ